MAATRELEKLGGTDALLRLSLSAVDLLEIDIDFRDLARQLDLYLSGRLRLRSLSSWVGGLRRVLSTLGLEGCGSDQRSLVTTACIVSLLLESMFQGNSRRPLRALKRIRRWLATGEPVLTKKLLPEALRCLAPLRLCTVENPFPVPACAGNQWVDVGLCECRSLPNADAPGDTLHVIPFSVFTRSFFWEELPALISPFSSSARIEPPRKDDFHYHPENDKALGLKERHPWLSSSAGIDGCIPQFEYYMDHDGLAEILLDVPSLGTGELLLATRLFCLQNRIRRGATLDGLRISMRRALLRQDEQG